MKVLEVHNYMESSMLGSWCNDDGYQYTISYTHICPVGMLGPWEWWYSKYPEVPNYVTIWYFCPCTLYGIAHNGILDIHRIRWFHAGNDENTIIDYGILKMDEYGWIWMNMNEYGGLSSMHQKGFVYPIRNIFLWQDDHSAYVYIYNVTRPWHMWRCNKRLVWLVIP